MPSNDRVTPYTYLGASATMSNPFLMPRAWWLLKNGGFRNPQGTRSTLTLSDSQPAGVHLTKGPAAGF